MSELIKDYYYDNTVYLQYDLCSRLRVTFELLRSEGNGTESEPRYWGTVCTTPSLVGFGVTGNFAQC